MRENVAIVGIGQTQIKTISPEMSYKELMFDAAVKAYKDAGINPRKDVGSFISAAEDFWEGTSIFDEYVPDQLGGELRPVCNITNEGVHALITGAMQILTGIVDTVVIESHSKISEVMYPDNILAFAMDPLINRPLKMNPHAIAGLEMTRFIAESGNSREDCANVVVKNKTNALNNPLAAYGANIDLDDVLSSELISDPITKFDISQPADGSIVIVLASEEKAKEYSECPIWITGMGWCNDTPTWKPGTGQPQYHRQWLHRGHINWLILKTQLMIRISQKWMIRILTKSCSILRRSVSVVKEKLVIYYTTDSSTKTVSTRLTPRARV